jgi:pSer/pThr/pTyr-binding forkhead associated (FHA) protein
VSIQLSLFFNRQLLQSFSYENQVHSISIGRAPFCSIVIDNLALSRLHCQIVKISTNLYVLFDRESTNGTYFRCHKITSHCLNDGDEFWMAKYSIRFHYLEKEYYPLRKTPLQADDNDRLTLVVNWGDFAESIWEERNSEEKYQEPTAYLVYTTENGIRKQQILQKTSTFFGSHPHCDYRIAGFGMYEKHALLLKDFSGFQLINLTPKEDITLNNQKIIHEARLSNGDSFQIGKHNYRFYYGAPSSK